MLQPGRVTADDVRALQRRGTRVLGYLSLGEDDRLRRGDGKGPGGQASWYVDEHVGAGFASPGSDEKPDSNPDWNSYYVDPSNRAWQKAIQTEVRHQIDDLGMDGVFVDTVLIPTDVFTSPLEDRMRRGMTRLLSSLKRWSRGGYVIVNNGEEATRGLDGKIDGLMIETSVGDGADRWDDVRLLSARLAPRRRSGFLVTALIYLPPSLSPADACATLKGFSLPAALYRDDAAGRALTTLPLATCPDRR